MGNIFSKTGVITVFISVSSCQFDGKGIEIIRTISEHYYVLEDVSANDYGWQIGYSLDNQTYQIIASRCAEVYANTDTIMYSTILFQGGDTSYYTLPVNPKREDGLINSPVQIKKAVFKQNIIQLNKIDLPI